jgi:hypothetical protein
MMFFDLVSQGPAEHVEGGGQLEIRLFPDPLCQHRIDAHAEGDEH